MQEERLYRIFITLERMNISSVHIKPTSDVHQNHLHLPMYLASHPNQTHTQTINIDRRINLANWFYELATLLAKPYHSPFIHARADADGPPLIRTRFNHNFPNHNRRSTAPASVYIYCRPRETTLSGRLFIFVRILIERLCLHMRWPSAPSPTPPPTIWRAAIQKSVLKCGQVRVF